MRRPINRRDFLKLAGLLPLSIASSRFTKFLKKPQTLQQGKQNIIIVVFDALTAKNIALYGYPRDTMPNLTRLAERAIVYHNHFAGASFTSPGTATLLSGTYPWTHRAFNPNGKVAESFASHNIFNAFKNHYRLAYTHNSWANTLLNQFSGDMDELVPSDSLFLTNDGFISTLFKKDEDIASLGWARDIKKKEEGFAYSLFLSELYERSREEKAASRQSSFPRGIPNKGGNNYFLLETATDWLGQRVSTIPQPFLGYFHFLPPHFPYNTPKDFVGWFANDGYETVGKPQDLFARERLEEDVFKKRTLYDEFILYADREFGRFYEYLEKLGLLENTWLVFTSDHGEMFERGITGHLTPTLYQPLVRVPLIIFEPGRDTRADIYTPTSAIDVLPTMLQVTGQSIPDWVEGSVLPPYAPDVQTSEHKVYVVQAKDNSRDLPLTEATVVMVKDRYKLIYYLGYAELKLDKGVNEFIQLYDIESDPEELNDLAASQKELAIGLLNELKTKLAEVNKPYRQP